MNLLISLRSELLKTKRTASFYLTFVAAAFGPFMSLLDILIGEGIPAHEKNLIFNDLFVKKFEMVALVALPMFIILICTLLPQIEYKNNAWKQVLTSPKTKLNIFISKFINVQLLIVAFFIINFILMFFCAVILHIKNPDLNVLSQPLNVYDIIAVRLNSYIALLGLCCIQFWLGLRFKNFIVPIALGIACWFTGTLLVMPLQSPIAEYFPYSYPAYLALPNFKHMLNAIQLTSVAYAAVFLVIGYLDFNKRRMNS